MKENPLLKLKVISLNYLDGSMRRGTIASVN